MQNLKLRVLVLPLLGAAGTILAIAWPVGHKAFCSGLAAVVA
jgi:hypothetical protein